MYTVEISVREGDREILLKTNLFVIGTMRVANVVSDKLKKLEEESRNLCMENNLTEVGGFTIMFDSENGRTIHCVKDMPIESTGMKEFYDRNSASFRRKYEDFDWPYTGFVQGNIAGWMPISTERLTDWLENSIYTVEDFIDGFRRNRELYFKTVKIRN